MMSMCRVFSYVAGRECLLWPVCSLGKALSCFTLYSKAKFACYSRCFLTSYFSIPVPYNEKGTFWGVSSKRSCRSSVIINVCLRHILSRSVSQFSHSVVSDSFQPHILQHTRLPCPSPTPRVYSNSSPLSWWCHPTISSSVIPFSSHLQSFPASGPFQMSQLFAPSGQSIGVSAPASFLPMDTQDWSPLGKTG